MSNKHSKGYMPWDRTGNRLLVKSQLASNKPTNYDIPHTNFVYGKTTPDDPEHASQVMYNWSNHQISANHNHLKQKDFMATNKQCLKTMLHTSSQFSGYRKSKTLYKAAKEGSNLIPILLPEQNHAYGKPLSLEDPIKLVIANSYGEDDQYSRQTFYSSQTQKSSAAKRKMSCFITKNHNLLKQATAKRLQKFSWERPDQLWKLNKFRDVGSKVETRRTRLESAN